MKNYTLVKITKENEYGNGYKNFKMLFQAFFNVF